ncbi:hypothetical protein AUR64_17880 [Haloprofundus marisrubri]|uniref:Uncharacterized protein n=1 Tax=Haloprofundus marisrubri TaxID=1514971 RepID=A0A0W1R638_9EURY|nr:hypothetical protein [Haloprofundus marisrubri]KTG08546.1 hypothetical protein AUR64_17880 [Haloprofundus marisrubri]
MAPVTMPPVEAAKRIFTRLGYTVSGEGTELRAEHKWRTVHVTAVADDDTMRRVLADGGRDNGTPLRCFVTWDEHADSLCQRLERTARTYEWAIISVADGETNDYRVIREDAQAVA